jgi:cytochrome c
MPMSMGRTIALFAGAVLLAATTSLAQAAGDPAEGEKVFAKCKICHQIGEGAKNAIGPELNGVIGRHSGTAPGYNYSDANKNSGITWDEKNFRDYIKNPKAKIPGTKMIFAGLPKDTDIDNLLAYLELFGPDGKKK